MSKKKGNLREGFVFLISSFSSKAVEFLQCHLPLCQDVYSWSQGLGIAGGEFAVDESEIVAVSCCECIFIVVQNESIYGCDIQSYPPYSLHESQC